MRRFKQFWNSILYFFVPAAGAASPLIVIPAVTSQLGNEGWVAMAIAQSVGAAAAVVAELGWGVVGPQKIANLNHEQREVLYRISLASRLLVIIPLSLVAATIAYFVTDSYRWDAAALAFATGLFALSPTWFFIGAHQPLRILIFESLPKILVACIAGALIFLGWPLLVFAVLILVQSLVTLFAAKLTIGNRSSPRLEDFKNSPRIICSQGFISLGRSISVIYTMLPITLVGWVRLDAVSAFASSDRLMRMSLSILAGLPSRLQSWLGSSSSADAPVRRRIVIVVNSMLGVLAGVSFIVLFPRVASWVFSDEIVVSSGVIVTMGLLLMTICASRGLGLVLVSLNRANRITVAIASAAAIGLVSLVPLTITLGPLGAALSALSAELIGLLVQIFLLSRRPK